MMSKYILQTHKVKWSNGSISNNLIQLNSTKLNISEYSYVSFTFQLKIRHLFIHS